MNKSELIRKGLHAIKHCNLVKSFFFCLRVLPFTQAIRCPILLGWNTRIRGCKRGSIILEGGAKPFSVLLGLTGSYDLDSYNPTNNYLEIVDGNLIFLGEARFGRHFSILVRNSQMIVGTAFHCNSSCTFSCVKGIRLGEESMLGAYVSIRDSDGHPTFELNENGIREYHLPAEDVSIGKHVWICNKCSILKGTIIKDGCIVGYGSLCSKEYEQENTFIAGVPAKVIKENIGWEE